jgi:26S proteasome regulatory subunit N2
MFFLIIYFILFFLAGIISLLEEPMPELKVFALKKLDLIVDEFWPEISEAIEKM